MFKVARRGPRVDNDSVVFAWGFLADSAFVLSLGFNLNMDIGGELMPALKSL